MSATSESGLSPAGASPAISDAIPPPAASHTASIIEATGRWLTMLGSVVAVGQAGTTWLNGYWQAASERQKSAQELQLAQLKDKTELAQQYLKVILDKDTRDADRAVLYTALAQIDGHPLQKWAQQQYEDYRKRLARLFEAYQAQRDAAAQRDSAEQHVASLSADIQAINSQIELVRDDPDKRQQLQDQLIAKSAELAHSRATLSVAVVKSEDVTTVISRSESGLPVAASATLADTITAVSSKVTVEMLAGLFAPAARPNIEIGAPYLQAALQEFKVADRRLVASIIATIAVETPKFEAYEDPVSLGARYEGRKELGNTQPGDGVRFRGRGYLGLTGRSNYERTSLRLGLGSRLLDSPDDAKSPEVAGRVLVSWFVDRQEQLLPALDSGDLARVRRLISGGALLLDRFIAAYNKVLAQL